MGVQVPAGFKELGRSSGGHWTRVRLSASWFGPLSARDRFDMVSMATWTGRTIGKGKPAKRGKGFLTTPLNITPPKGN